MKPIAALRLPLMSLPLLLLPALPVSAQDRAADVPVICEVDLSVFPGLPDEFAGSSYLTEDAVLHCPGSNPGQTLQLRCFEQLDGWTGGRISTSDFVCDLTDKDCPGIENGTPSPADNQRITIGTDGLVELFCQRNTVQ